MVLPFSFLLSCTSLPLAISWAVLPLSQGGGDASASTGWRSELLLNLLQCTGQVSTMRHYLTQSVTTTMAEKSCLPLNVLVSGHRLLLIPMCRSDCGARGVWHTSLSLTYILRSIILINNTLPIALKW